MVATTDGLITSSTGPGTNPSTMIPMINGVSTAISRRDRSGNPVLSRRAAMPGSSIEPGPPADELRPAEAAAGTARSRAPSTAAPRSGPCMVRW
jgi:hypothetical protein